MQRSEITIEKLHTQGKLDKQLSRSFNFENALLDKARRTAILRKNSPYTREYFHLLNLQYKITRAIYQQSDEYKKTRGTTWWNSALETLYL